MGGFGAIGAGGAGGGGGGAASSGGAGAAAGGGGGGGGGGMGFGKLFNAGGQIVGAYGQYQAGRLARKLSRLNAGILNYQAKNALLRGKDAVKRLQIGRSQVIGRQRVALAGSGFELGEGTAAELQADTARLIQRDIQTIRTNAALEAWGYKQQAAVEKFQGDVAQYAGKVGAIGGGLGAAGTLFGG